MGRVSRGIIMDVMAADTEALRRKTEQIEQQRNADVRSDRLRSESDAWNEFTARLDAEKERDALKKAAVELMLDRKAMMKSFKLLAQKWGKSFDEPGFNVMANGEYSIIAADPAEVEKAEGKVNAVVEKIIRSRR